MIFFKPLKYNIATDDPYAKAKDYEEKERNKTLYNGKEYEKIIYKNKKTQGFCWKLSHACLLILSCLTVYPLIRQRKRIAKLWKQIKAGQDFKVVLIASKQIKPKKHHEKTQITKPEEKQLDQQVQEPENKNDPLKGILKKEKIKKKKKHVHFEQSNAEKNIKEAKIDKVNIKV